MDYLSLLPHINAALNGLAAVLLVAGYVLIKQRRERAHKWTMLACFGVSAVFLVCYLTYHIGIGGSKKFPADAGHVRTLYLVILATHAILAAAVPLLAVITIYLGLRDRRVAHRRWARWTFPIWLYVSITGVIVYLMLYQMYTPRSSTDAWLRPDWRSSAAPPGAVYWQSNLLTPRSAHGA